MGKIWKAARPLAAITAALVLASCGGGGQDPQLASKSDAVLYTLQPCPPGFNNFALAPAGGVLGFPPLASLATIANPVLPKDPKTGAYLLRADLAPYIANLPAAIQLGKALFWDIQAGSDNKVSCATCHFQAGADVRTRNQLNPGANGTFDSFGTTTYGPNFSLTAADFPFVDPVTGKNVDNASGSQGVRSAVFGGVSATGVDMNAHTLDIGRKKNTEAGLKHTDYGDTLVDLTDTWVRAAVPETYADKIALGDTLQVRMPSGALIPGKVIFKNTEGDFATQRDVSRTKRDIKTFEVRLRADNRDRRLAVGMTAYVLLPVS